jgi:hypothetical protein
LDISAVFHPSFLPDLIGDKDCRPLYSMPFSVLAVRNWVFEGEVIKTLFA